MLPKNSLLVSKNTITPKPQNPNIIEKNLLSIDGISRFKFEDDKLLKSLLLKNPVQYARSFLYLLRASHGDRGLLGYKYVNPNLIAIIGYRNNIIYVTVVMDKTQGVVLKQICKEISNRTSCQILLKKFTQEKYPKMNPIQKPKLSENELEDDSYPETMIDLPTLFIKPEAHINPKASRFIKKVKRFEKFNIEIKILEDLSHIALSRIKKYLMTDYDKYINYLPIITYLYHHRKDDLYKIMIFSDNLKIIGLYIAEILSKDELGLYCAVNLKYKPGSTEWMDWYFFKKMFHDGFKKIYFGGAETAGVDYYIKKLLPSNPDYHVETVEYFIPSLNTSTQLKQLGLSKLKQNYLNL